MPSSGVEPPGDMVSDIMPEWMSCDLVAYNILQEVSSQIVSHCESFGKHLEGVCGQAIERLPPSDGTDPFDCSDACITFISAFGALSHELLQLAGDVDCSVKKPLQGIIHSLTEERAGRMNHWNQVKNRFAELQERYRRSRLRSIEARGKLDRSKGGNKSHWFRSKTDEGQAATEQHAAMCDLAECEEELRESEASLRRLEEENKEILRKLDREKQADLRSFLAKGTSSLRRLVSVTDKALANETAPESSSTSGAKPASPTSWAGVLPSRIPNPEKVNDKEEGQEAGDKTEDVCERPPESVVPQPPVQEAIPDPAESNLASTDPSAKYLQGSGASIPLGGGFDISELTDSEDEEDASSRAAAWTPAKDSPLTKGTAKRQSFVFQSSGGSSLLGGDVRPLTRKSSPMILSSPTAPKVSSPEHPSVSAALSLNSIRSNPVEQGLEASPTPTAEMRPVPRPLSEASYSKPLATASVANIRVETEMEHKPSPTRRKVAVVDDSSEDEDNTTSSPSGSSGPKPPLERAEMKLEVVPLVAEAAQKYFERYVQRVPETLQLVSESSWSKLQERASESCLGGQVGKLEFFWICLPRAEPTPEGASGLVCFQFVQGFSSNFARILHLSVVEQSSGKAQLWSSILPSAIFEVRRFIFQTLPVQSIRATVLMCEDESGSLCVDGDVEVAYQRCRFKWFQLTQNLRRSRSGIRRKKKVKPSTRFMVLHTPRLEEIDPKAPRQTSVQPMPALLLRDEPGNSDSTLQSPAGEQAEAGGKSSFSAW
jgi:hypothetical protein